MDGLDPAMTRVPAIPGLVIRPFRDVGDCMHMVAVREAARQRDRVDPTSPLESIPTLDELLQAVADGTVDASTVLMAEAGPSVVGYNRIALSQDQEGVDVLFHRGWVIPAWRGRGIGHAMLRLAEERLRALAASEETARRAVFATTIASTEREALALLRDEGYEQAWRVLDLIADTHQPRPAAPLPPRVELRPVLPAHDRAIFQAAQDAWRGEQDAPQDEQQYLDDTVRAPGFDVRVSQSAWADGEVVGLVLCRVGHGEGFILDVAVRHAWQRRGLATALLNACLDGLREYGIGQARLYSAAGNAGLRQLYESLGFHAVKEHIRYQKSVALLP